MATPLAGAAETFDVPMNPMPAATIAARMIARILISSPRQVAFNVWMQIWFLQTVQPIGTKVLALVDYHNSRINTDIS